MIYIDPYSDSISNLTRLAGMLQDAKSQNVAKKIQMADLLNRQGKNLEAEEMLRSANNYGLSRLFADDAKEWTAEGINAGMNPQKQELIKSPILNAQQEIMKEMQDLYGDDTQGYNKNLQALAADMTNRDIQDRGISRDNTKVSQPMWNEAAKEFGDNLKGIKANETAVNEYNQIQKRNADIEEYNKNLKPIYREKYTGNEVDQQQQLMNDTILAMDSAKSMKDKLNLYNKYVTTGKAISDHYGHRFEGQPAAFFGIGGKSSNGAGAKMERINIYIPGQEKPIGAVKVSDSFLASSDPQAFIFKNFKGIMDRYNITDPSQFTYKFASSEGAGELNPYEKVKMKKDNVELDEYYKSQAQKAYDEANDWSTWKESTKVKKANATLSPDNPYAWDESGNLVDTRTVQGSSTADNNNTGYQHLYLKKK